MSEIICECGHGVEEHDFTGCNCGYDMPSETCMCELSQEAIEARYWARKCYRANNANYDTALEALVMLKKTMEERDALRAKLDELQKENDELRKNQIPTGWICHP